MRRDNTGQGGDREAKMLKEEWNGNGGDVGQDGEILCGAVLAGYSMAGFLAVVGPQTCCYCLDLFVSWGNTRAWPEMPCFSCTPLARTCLF